MDSLLSVLGKVCDGLRADGSEELAARIESGAAGLDDPSRLVEALIEARSELRGARKFASADDIRNSLAELGYVLEDKPQGTRWRRATP